MSHSAEIDRIASLRGQLAANERWAHEGDRSEATRPGREAFEARFEREVDPDGKLPPAERAKRALNARRAYFTRLALKRHGALKERSA